MDPLTTSLRSFAEGLNGTRPESGFNPYAAGAKHYGGGRNFPTSGSVNKAGYSRRDNEAQARRNALLRRLQQEQAGNFLGADVNRPMKPGS